jgi:hypothetical protein
MTSNEYYETKEQAINDWVPNGEIVAEKEIEKDHTYIIIVKDADGYTILRAFTLGMRWVVSVDANEKTADDIIKYLLEMEA